MSLNNNNSTVKKPTTPQGTTDSPYLGSKISLVSKAKIRYEGILYTIDANESTVALSKVRSFGTEDRPTDRPVPARDEIFEYIIFRGADIEDLQVREPPQTSLTQDPAIVESSAHPSSARSASTTNTNNQARSSALTTTQPGQFKAAQSTSNADPLRQLNFNQQQQQQQQSTRSFDNQRRQRQQQQDYNNDNNSYRRGNNQKYGNYDEWPRTNNNSAWDNQYRQQNQRYPRQQNYDNNNRFYPQRRTNNNNNHQQQQQQQSNGYYGYRERRNSTGDMTSNNSQRTNRQQRERADSTRGNSTNQSALKFIGDFDFEKSNAEFDKNAIENELKKSLSIKPNNQTTTNEKENTDDQNQQDQEQKQETPNLPTEEQDANSDGFYDKQKSFFDRISCETTEKEKTTNPRRNWNEERRINAETFGLKYRPAQQGGNQRNGPNYSGYNNNNNRRYYSGQQSYYGNGARYQRGGYSAGNDQQQQQRGGRSNTTYYSNSNRRMQAY